MFLEKVVVSQDPKSANHKEKSDKLNYATLRMFVRQRHYPESKMATHRLGEYTATHIQNI